MSNPVAPFNKPARTIPDLIQHLQSKGLIIPDVNAANAALRSIGYYRLLIYMRPHQDSVTKRFIGGTAFDQILLLYNFDRKLRLLCLDAIERIEVALRAAIINSLTVPLGSQFYLESCHFESLEGYKKFLTTAANASYLAITHYNQKYNHPSLPPVWAITEAISFGALSQLFSNLHLVNRKLVAGEFGLDETLLVSWFRSLNGIRNMCAHHNRLWNFAIHVNKPKTSKPLRSVFTGSQASFYARAVVIQAILKQIDPNSDWSAKLKILILSHPSVTISAMGFPNGWDQNPFWI